MYNIFKKYYKIVYENGKKEDYKELYAYYQTLLLSILYMLPSLYAQELLKTEEYKDLKEVMKICKLDETLEDVNIKTVYLDSLELSIRKHISDKYNTDIYDTEYTLKKTI